MGGLAVAGFLLAAPNRAETAPAKPAATAAPRAIVSGGPPPPIMKLADVRPGMTGYALTVFKGTKPEKFNIRVVSILRKFLPKQDVILIRAEDQRVEHSGIVAGMSGSPVYIDGKLVGAVAYAWNFSKDPLGGVTPIETMLGERGRPRRGSPDKLAAADDATAAKVVVPASGGTASSTEPRLVRASVPLSVSGFNPRSVAEIADELRPMGLVPMQAGGGRSVPAKAEPGHIEPGSAVGVELVRGDMSMVGTGTVTYIDGSTVLAFGHPMFGIGESYLPLVDAEIHSFLPSLAQSFKMSSPLNEIGMLTQDRQSCIIGTLDERTRMMPVDVRITAPEGKARTFHAEVARSRRLTPMLAAMVVGNAVTDAEPDVTDVVATVKTRLQLPGGRAPLELTDQFFSTEGLSGRGLGMTRGMRALGELMFNPFEPLTVEKLDVEVRIEHKRDVAEIIGLSLPNERLRPGETVPVRVTLRPYAGNEYVETVIVQIPRTVAGQAVRIEAASGVLVRPELPSPESLSTYIDNMTKYYTAGSIVVSVQTADEGASLRGRLVPDLPSAAIDTLRTGNQTRRAESYSLAQRTVFPSKRIVVGRQELTTPVREDVLGTNR